MNTTTPPTHAIIARCHISDSEVRLNDQLICQRQSDSEIDWLTEIYRAIGMQYPKFFKMDNLCKAGVLAAEILLKAEDYDREQVKSDWAVVLMNSASSLDNDRRYQQTIRDKENYYPSPAIFVYTLANIVTGEICIRHKIGGESAFYVLPEFDEHQLQQIVSNTFTANPELTHILCGWVEIDKGKTDVFLYFCRQL